MPSGLIDNDDGMSAGCDGGGDLLEVQRHGCGVAFTLRIDTQPKSESETDLWKVVCREGFRESPSSRCVEMKHIGICF